MCTRKVLIFAILAVCFTSYAISVSAQGIRPGVEIGVSAVSLSYDSGPHLQEDILIPPWDFRSRVSFSAMAFIDVQLGGSWSLQPGLRFSQVGDKASYNDSEFDYAREKRQQYISIPVRLRYNILSGPIFAVAGPELGYLIHASSTYETSFLNSGYPSEDQRFDDYLRRTNLAVGIGTGASIRLFGRKMHLQIYHSEGVIGNVEAPERQPPAVRRIGGYDWKTRETVLSIGYTF